VSQQSASSQVSTEANIAKADQDAVNEAIDVFQDTVATDLPIEELVVGFSVLENPSKARLFLCQPA